MSEYEPISFNRDLAVEQNENNDKASLRIHSDVDESSGEDEERYSNKLSWNQFAKMLRLVFLTEAIAKVAHIFVRLGEKCTRSMAGTISSSPLQCCDFYAGMGIEESVRNQYQSQGWIEL
ncbi:hypothetical protein L917_06650 [Phytophthora nicotianae]|uniref:Uncharacterized protein n=2 Tax=Phytophthora nicotianae TaxID=4792 RepID=V9FFC4_PHYNI|nr:hypothetical protein F443_06961 [Phytophthora nicotianae P1569]ETL95571.1 hypothetical protein L917_06650 [Phytophthora nicotianae]ETM48774.1 hypothetical protein L914_06743 [Phytophthora nicotianae]